MKKKCTLFVILLFAARGIAQVNDAQLWENVNIEKNFSPKLLARINQQGRIVDNISTPGFNYFDMGVNYKFSKHFHGTLAYVWVQKRRLDDSWSMRHQAYLALTFRKRLGALLFTDRQMFLWQVKDIFTSAYGHIPDYYLRNKVTIRWDKTFRFQPYVASEIYYRTYGPEKQTLQHFNRVRYFAGLFYHPDQDDELEAYYLLEKHFHEFNPQTNWVIGLGYSHSF